MHIAPTPLKPLSNAQLSPDEEKILAWLRSAKWEAQPQPPMPYKAKVPEYYNGVRFYSMQGNAKAQGALELFLKKLEYQGIISKQEMHPLAGHGNNRFLLLTKADLENLRGAEEEDGE